MEHAIVGENTVIQAGAHVGCVDGEGWMMIDRNAAGITVVEANIVVPANLRACQGRDCKCDGVAGISGRTDFIEGG